MGGRTKEIIPVAKRVDGTDIGIPVLTITGDSPGPTLMIVGGVHGDEQEGISSVLELYEKVEPASLKGKLIGITTLNVAAYEHRRRGNPLDDWYYDMNRLFPGSPTGSQTQRIAAKIVELSGEADYCIAIHSGGSNLNCCPRVITPEFTGACLDLAKAMGPSWEFIAKGGGERVGVADFTSVTARNGKPSITLELGGLNDRLPQAFKRDVGLLVEGLTNVLRFYGMIAEEWKRPKEWTLMEYEPIRCSNAGLFRFTDACRVGGKAKAGTLLASLVDVLGNVVEEVKMPFDGVLLAIPGQVSLSVAGAQIGSAGRVKEVVR